MAFLLAFTSVITYHIVNAQSEPVELYTSRSTDISMTTSTGNKLLYPIMQRKDNGSYAYCLDRSKKGAPSGGAHYDGESINFSTLKAIKVKRLKTLANYGLGGDLENKLLSGLTEDEKYAATQLAYHIYADVDDITKEKTNAFQDFELKESSIKGYIEASACPKFKPTPNSISSEKAFKAAMEILIKVAKVSAWNGTVSVKKGTEEMTDNGDGTFSCSITITPTNCEWKLTPNVDKLSGLTKVTRTTNKGTTGVLKGNSKETITLTFDRNRSVSLKVIPVVSGTSAVENIMLGKISTDDDSYQRIIYYNDNKFDSVPTEVEFGQVDYAKLQITKKDKKTGEIIKDYPAKFGVYSDSNCTDLIETTVTEDGIATCSKLEPGKYYIKELKAPNGYIRDSVSNPTKFVHKVLLTGNKTTYFELENEQAQATIKIKKVIKGTSIPVKDVVYRLYAKSDIVFNGKTIFKEGDLAFTFPATNDKGEAKSSYIPFGEYNIVEYTCPDGIVLDTTKHPIKVSYKNDSTVEVIKNVTLSDEYATVKTKLIKKNRDSDVILNEATLAGAEYGLYAEETINDTLNNKTYVKDDLIQTVTTITDVNNEEQAVAEWDSVPVGKYYIKEIKAPKGYKLDVTKYSFEVKEPNTVVIETEHTVEVEEQPESRLLTIVKKDLDSNSIVKKEGFAFQIYKKNSGECVSYTDEDGNLIDTFVTDSDGYAKIAKPLGVGTYVIKEVDVAEGYVLNDKEVEFVINEDIEDDVLEVAFYNKAVKGNITVKKEGEVLTDYIDGKFVYDKQILSGIEFDLYAAEDIYVPYEDTIVYKKGTKVANAVTGEDGYATFNNLLLGKYIVKESSSPSEYVKNNTKYSVELVADDTYSEIVLEEITVLNKKKDLALSLSKISSDKDNLLYLKGAEFNLIANENIVNYAGKVIVKKNTILDTAVTDKNGRIVFRDDLPLSVYSENFLNKNISLLYRLEETKAPDGYIKNTKPIYLSGSIDGTVSDIKLVNSVDEEHIAVKSDNIADEEVLKINYEVIAENKSTEVHITKVDATTGKELPGATLVVKDSKGKTVDKWVSTKEAHIIKGLKVGKYTLTETIAPKGYYVAKSITFEVKDDGKVTKVVMKDKIKPIKTGDNSNYTPLQKYNPLNPNGGMMMYIIMFVIALFAGGFLGFRYIRR